MRSGKWKFLGDTVASARDPNVEIDIMSGIHEVIFDDVVSRTGNGPECEIWNMSEQTRQRILVETLDELEETQRAAPYHR
jgi:hypothetical protein